MNGVLNGGQQVPVLKRAIEAAHSSDKVLVIVLIVQIVFYSLMRLQCVSIQFHFLYLTW